MAGQWLGLFAFTAKGAVSVTGQGTTVLIGEWDKPEVINKLIKHC